MLAGHIGLGFDIHRLGKTLQTLSLIFALRSAGLVRAPGRQSPWSQAGHGNGGGGGGGGGTVGKVLLVTPASLTSN